MEPPEKVEAALQPPADQVVTQPVGQSSLNQPGAQDGPGPSLDQRQRREGTADWQHQEQSAHIVELEFQDSNLSPALPLLPVASRSQPGLTECSLLQQSDNEFAPLRAYPDVSQASHHQPQDHTVQASEPDSLSQHLLAIETLLSEEGGSSSFCSLSQHSLTPGVGRRRQQEVAPRASMGRDRENQQQKLSEDETYFLSQDIPAHHLLDILQKEVGMPSSSSSAVSSASEMLMRREGPPGEASLPPPRPSRPSEVCNITVGSRSTLPDLSSESLHRELVSESQNGRRKTPSPPARRLTPRPSEPSVTRAVRGDLSSAGPLSAGPRRERDLWSSGNQTGIEGSYLGFLPQSQSTPGIFQAPPKSNVTGKLSAIESDKENSAASEPDLHRLEEQSSARVRSLPSLNYLQKVDAWRANQSAGKPSLFDSLALQGFSGVSPKKKAYEAVSDSLNRILGDKARRLQQPAPEQSAGQSPASSSPRRGEAAGSAPSDRDNTGSLTRPFSSPLGKSQSHSSLSTVVMSTQKQKEEGHRAGASARRSAAAAALDLGHLSDVSAEQDLDLTLSSSQDSNKSGAKLETSVGASSSTTTSLEVDNYAPYWTSKAPSTPPPPRELNIEERIPLYLHNLGIDQSPSTILTPFAPRGPIREPEFSPTDLCTMKGSTQPSEGGSPHKAEFSRSSALSVSSSVSFSVDSLGPAASTLDPARPEPPPAAAAAAAVVRSKVRAAPAPQRVEEDSAHSSSSFQQMDSAALDPSLGSLVTRAKAGEVPPSGSFAAAAAASAYPLPPHLMSDDDILLSLRRRTGQDSAFSLFGAASSSLWARSSSDSMLTSERTRQSSVGGEGTAYPSAPQPPTAAAAAEGSTLVLSKPARRAEPEGCSAAPPDTNVPQQQQQQQQQLLPEAALSPSPQLLTSTPVETTGSSEAEEAPAPAPRPPSSPAQEESDQGEDGSSQSSLAERVAKLLEDPSLMVSSSLSTTDPEDCTGRERVRPKASARQSEALRLNEDDRKRIEEIKKELLLTVPTKNQLSSDTESSVASSDRVARCHAAPHSTEMLPPQGGAVRHRSQPLRSLAASAPLRPETVEAKFQMIVAREGVALCGTRPPRSPTSISIATCRRSLSPTPSASPAPPARSLTPEPLHLSELSSRPQLRQRRDAVGGRFEEDAVGTDARAEPLGPEDENSAPSGGRTPDSPASHVSHVHLTLSPKPERSAARPTAPPPARPDGLKPRPRADFAPLRRSPSTVVSPDEGVGLTSPPEWSETRECRAAAALHHRATAYKRVAISESPPVPVLLPYKPPGSQELFYVPQFEADVSDTTVESSHTGSDDAVAPPFSSDVLGHQDPGLDRGVSIRHSEGIYSKRLHTVCMEGAGHRDESPTAHKRSQTSPSSVHLGRASSSSSSKKHVTSYREQGTSPLHFAPEDQPSQRNPEPSPDTSEPRTGDEEPGPSSPHRRRRPQQQRVSLDELWRRFCVRWAIEQARPAGAAEAPLLERLERLSCLIYSSSGAEEPPEEGGGGADRARRASRPAGGGHASLSASQSLNLSPTDRESSSGSVSSVDTERLVRVFGARRVKQLRAGSALGQLHSAIHRQRRGRSPGADRRHVTESTDESQVVADSASSTCTSASPAQPRSPRTNGKLVSKKIQTASDLEIVRNGTRRHTRDVGTTFPSPHEPVTIITSSSSGSERGRRGPRGRTSQKPKRNKQNWGEPRHPAEPRPPAVSWFIPADEDRRSSDSRKENRRQGGEPAPGPSAAWFEPYTGTPAWREPLRQRQVQEEEPTWNQAEPGHVTKTPRALTLQEALELRRPDFISRSEERMKRLSLQAEERQQQVALLRERYGLFGQYRAAERLRRPAGLQRRAVPRKEMIQRSKQIYENLPEIRRKKAEERRKAEYRSYRLNAQLFNKRITNHVLGRRLAWQ